MLKIDKAKCNRDGLCAAVCPVGIIELDANKYPFVDSDAEERCIDCGQCVAICPLGCLDHSAMVASECTEVQSGLRISQEQCEQLFKSRRSVRNFRKKKVVQNIAEELLDLARYAPSGHNSGGVHWLVLADTNELQALKESVAGWMQYMLEKMPDFALSLHLDITLKRWTEGEDVILRNAPMLLVAYAEKDSRMAPASCSIALSHLELAASIRGLGACWAGYFNAAANAFPPMQKLLALPDGHVSYGAMMLGYPQFSYSRIPKRKDAHITWRL
jgi:nitroreductase/NAD-dependent dihydropyrimidine dehydrogenase PreA subunit